MRDDPQDDAAAQDVIAEMRALVDETLRAIEASQAILDRCATEAEGGHAAAPVEHGDDTALGAISDGLLRAYHFARQDGDPLTVMLIERALFHVGRRLALGLSPADAGLVCH